jgi:BirA family biotin operon repressor/biotin-[acetyl-CoA-carboxylase] ligase
MGLDQLTPEGILDDLRTELLGRCIVYHETADSTNAVAKKLAQRGAEEGTLVIAEQQTAGRGRLGRKWLAPRGTSLLFSLVFRPDLAVERAHGLTMVCGLGSCEAIHALTDLPAKLKWPNDILLHGRKAGGILTEVSTIGMRLDHAVIGIGLNVNLEVATLPTEFNATSISNELGHTVSRLSLLQTMLCRIERRYSMLCQGKWPVKDWAAALDTIGQRVKLHTAQGILEGTATAVDEEGALMLCLDNGKLRKVHVGDIMSSQNP